MDIIKELINYVRDSCKSQARIAKDIGIGRQTLFFILSDPTREVHRMTRNKIKFFLIDEREKWR